MSIVLGFRILLFLAGALNFGFCLDFCLVVLALTTTQAINVNNGTVFCAKV